MFHTRYCWAFIEYIHVTFILFFYPYFYKGFSEKQEILFVFAALPKKKKSSLPELFQELVRIIYEHNITGISPELEQKFPVLLY